MDIYLSPEQEAYVQERVANGQYASTSDLIQAALHLHRLHEQLEETRLTGLRREIALGIAQSDRGEVKPFDPEAIKAEGRKILALRGRK